MSRAGICLEASVSLVEGRAVEGTGAWRAATVAFVQAGARPALAARGLGRAA